MESSKVAEQLENWKQEVLTYWVKDPRRAIKACTEIANYAQKCQDSENLAFAYFYSGECHYALNEINSMIGQMTNAVVYLSLSNQWELLARAQNLLGITMANRGNIPVALDYYLAGIKNCREHNVTAIICSIHINLGFLYLKNGVNNEAQRCFEEAYEFYQELTEEERQNEIVHLTMIYANLAICYMVRGELETAQEYIEKIGKECQPYFEEIDYVYMDCLKVYFFHSKGDYEQRDACIGDIDMRITEPMPLLELFDDLEMLCALLLEIKQFDVFLHIVDRLQSLVTPSEIMDVERRLLALRIEYYRVIGDDEEYMKATGLFYELVRTMDKEGKDLISNMLYIRTALERAHESRRKMEKENEILMMRSETDAMTGLANRYRLTDHFDKALEKCCDQKQLLSVEILDVDCFKEYNDNYGHQAGDECIQAIASLLKKMEEDEHVFCARYGGDEFIIIYSGVEAEDARKRAEQLRQDVIGLQIVHEYSKVYPYVTISQGICQAIPIHGNKSWDFLHVADEMLYNVKRSQRNSICVKDFCDLEADSKC